VKRRQVVARDHDPHLERSQPEGGVLGQRLGVDVAAEREGDRLPVGVEGPRGGCALGARQSTKRPLGYRQRFDEIVVGRLAERGVDPEEAPLRAQRVDTRSLRRIEPVQDVCHALTA
jgi:hypothetical protein